MASIMLKAFTRAEDVLNAALTERFNPLYRLGAVAVFLLWVLLATGVYLFIFYRIGAPYDSVKEITEGQWGAGNFARSLHRYAAALLMAVALLHLLREFVKGRFRHARWLAWVSGVACLGALLLSGVVGYWMVWDERAQLIAQAASRLLDLLPIFGESLSLAFSTPELVTSMFFLIALFVHITVPLMLFVLVWVHVMRISGAVINPPAAVGAGVLVFLSVASLIRPVVMLPAADTARIITESGVDWFYLFVLPAAAAMPPWAVLAALAAAAALLGAAPWIAAPKRAPAASVVEDSCTGCEQCMLDCPYGAVRMDGGPTAEVIPSKCVSCGICAGSCAFGAISFPAREPAALEAEARALASGGGRILYVLCDKVIDRAGALKRISSDPGVGVLRLPCAGMLNASLAAAALESGAAGVFIHACSGGDCRYRSGAAWLEERLASRRRPWVAGKDAPRVAVEYSSLADPGLAERLASFRKRLEGGRAEG